MGAPGRPLLLLLGAGFGIWAAGFTVVYGVLSLGCELGWHTVALGPLSLQRATLIGLSLATVAASALLAALLWAGRAPATEEGGPAAFLRRTALKAALAATAAVVVTFSGVATLSTCVP